MQRKALFVGINDYEGGLAPLSCACNDANDLCDYFRDQLGSETYVLRNADILKIRKKIAEVTAELQKGDVFLFFFAGHGFTVDKGENNDRRLATARDLKDHLEEGEGGISLRRLKKLTKGGYSRVFILDACQTKIDTTNITRSVGNLEQEKFRTRDLSIISSIVGAKNDVEDVAPLLVINSCNVGDVAYELERNGLFTWAFLEMLSKMKDNGEAPVFNAKLVEHIAEQMQSHPGRFRQTPVFFTSDETNPEISVFSETSVDSHEAATSALVMCPICGKKNRPEDTFKCRECGRDNLCLRHQDEKTFLCADCRAKKACEESERKVAEQRMGEAKTTHKAKADGARDLCLLSPPIKDKKDDEGSWCVLTSYDRFHDVIEVDSLGHGLFTAAMLETIREYADNGDRLEVEEALYKAVSAKMERLTLEYGISRHQCPVYSSSGARFALMEEPSRIQGGKRVAMFVGINDYADPTIKSLRYAVPDAVALANAFNHFLKFDRVETLINPGHSHDVETAVKDMTKGLGRGDLFLFFFAGYVSRVRENLILVCAKDEFADLRVEYAGLPLGKLKGRMRGLWNSMLILEDKELHREGHR